MHAQVRNGRVRALAPPTEVVANSARAFFDIRELDQSLVLFASSNFGLAIGISFKDNGRRRGHHLFAHRLEIFLFGR